MTKLPYVGQAVQFSHPANDGAKKSPLAATVIVVVANELVDLVVWDRNGEKFVVRQVPYGENTSRRDHASPLPPDVPQG
jgi:hypothetical protein